MPVYIPNETAEGIGHGVQAGTGLVNNIMHLRAQERADTAQMRRQAMDKSLAIDEMLIKGVWDNSRQQYVPLNPQQQQYLIERQDKFNEVSGGDVDRYGRMSYNDKARPGQTSPIFAQRRQVERAADQQAIEKGYTMEDAVEFAKTGTVRGHMANTPEEQAARQQQMLAVAQRKENAGQMPQQNFVETADVQNARANDWANAHMYYQDPATREKIQADLTDANGQLDANNAAFMRSAMGLNAQPLTDSRQTIIPKGDPSKAAIAQRWYQGASGTPYTPMAKPAANTQQYFAPHTPQAVQPYQLPWYMQNKSTP